MAGAGVTIVRRIRSLLGSDAVVDTDRTGLPRATPGSEDALAVVLGAASAEGWKVRIEGGAGWMPPDAPADLALSTAGLTGVTDFNAPDLVVSARAGTRWETLRGVLAEDGAWVMADPPGRSRTLGSIVATATSGPLRAGAGAVRDQLLGLTLVTGDGRIVRPGGKVMKNVAGFDLTRLAAGSYGAFGVITSVTLRLRTVPRSDLTLAARGPRDGLLDAARAVLDAGHTPAALELLSPVAADADAWTLAVRLVGPERSVAAQRDGVLGSAPLTLDELSTRDGARLWQGLAGSAASGQVTLRLGALPTALDAALDLVEHHLPEGWTSVTVGGGTLRWSGHAPADRVKLLRHAAAQQEMPLTLERAPWTVRSELGHFGAYREGVGRLVQRLRDVFDPAGALVTGVGGE